MKAQPPYISDEQADRVWHASNDAVFGRVSPTILEIQQQIDNLQSVLKQRQQSASGDKQKPRQTPSSNLTSRVFRQNKRPDVTEDNLELISNQSKLGNTSEKLFFNGF
jgi:hypothetical protein